MSRIDKKVLMTTAAMMMASFILLFHETAFAATYYMPDNFTSLQAAFAGMSSGDTLIIRDGTYTGASNTILDNNNQIPNGPGTGSGDARFTCIKAEHAGSVTFDGEGSRRMFFLQASNSGHKEWIKFEGIIWRNTPSECAWIQGVNGGTANSHIVFSKCGFCDGGITASTSSNGLYVRSTNYALIEDCYAWGELYYGMVMERCQYSIFRRCVGRYDIHRGDRGGVIGVYSSNYIEVQNCIAIDCDRDASYTSPAERMYGFAYPTTDGPSTYVHTVGCIALNLNANSKIVFGLFSSNGGGSNNTFEDNVFYDASGGFWDRVTASTYNHCVIGGTKGYGVSEGLACDNNGSVRNSIFLNNVGAYGSNVTTSNYNAYYSNTHDVKNTPGAYDYCQENNNQINPLTNSLLYLTRIEPSSTLTNRGSDGGRIGPQILYRIGTTGSFYGETGYASVSSTSLWPFPNEETIKTKMSAYTGNVHYAVTGARGFCASGKQFNGTDNITLTSYIWEYLGNRMPLTIYDTDGDTNTDSTPPARPSGITVIIQ